MKKIFEIAAEQWGDTNTIQYFVTGYTQIAKAVFNSKKELMEIFQGIADDYFSAKAEEEPIGALTEDEIKALGGE
jgi:hypothetical protein